MRVSYCQNPEVAITVQLIHVWGRADLQEPVMSASSGMKDYVRNHVWAIFARYPNVARVLMVRGEYSEIGRDKHTSPPFLLVENRDGEAFDMAGEPVLVEDPVR